jgi:tetratricopeptide (TPR) repeat protein
MPAGAQVGEHRITCASEEVAQRYYRGLRSFHAGEHEPAGRDFREVMRLEPECAMARWGLSRVLDRQGDGAGAREHAAQAAEREGAADDRQVRLIQGWSRLLNARAETEAEARTKAIRELRVYLDQAISMYPDDPELWLLRAEVEADNPLRAGPYVLGALTLLPDHPIAARWSPSAPPPPEVEAMPTEPIAPLTEAPRLFQGLGSLQHPISAADPRAQAYYEQGLRCLHSYVTPEGVRNSAAVNFHYAASIDPTCAMAYWGLSYCLKDSGPYKPKQAAQRALELARLHGTDKERRLTAARVLELAGGERREEFLDALDGAIAVYPDDVEIWVWRGKAQGGFGRNHVPAASIPFQITAHRMAPEHPAPNHELVHAYEMIDRPALGWPYSIGYRASAPNMPHAHHMQAHLAMRLGRWQDAIDATKRSRRKAMEGYPELDPSHHIDILIRSLAHEGRFSEAEAEPRAYRDGLPWARLLQLKSDQAALAEWAENRRAANVPEGWYMSAIVRLDQDQPEAAMEFFPRIAEDYEKNKANLYRHHELRGRYLVQTGKPDEGLPLLREAAARAVKDPHLHAWGGGSYVLEVWGEAALRAGRLEEAEEAFHEALAHEHGSILGALGMQVVSEVRNRPELVEHYAARARRIWKDADAGALERQLARLRRLAYSTP